MSGVDGGSKMFLQFNIPVDLYLKPSSPFDQSAVVLARRILKVYTSSNFTSNSHSHKPFYLVVIELQTAQLYTCVCADC